MEALPQVLTMPDKIRIIALDLDGTLLNSNKQLSAGNLAALQKAADAGIEIVPTTGRFFGGMPDIIRQLPFVRYAITVNGAEVADVQTGSVIYKAELPWQQSVDIMRYLDGFSVIYDCYLNNEAWMTRSMKQRIDDVVEDKHYRRMLHELRQPVPELKSFLSQRRENVQKIQLFTADSRLRLDLMRRLPELFENLCVSSSISTNVEINQTHANKGEALLALAKHLGVSQSATMAFGDGLNDLSMLRDAGIAVAMSNACAEAKQLADWVSLSCDEDGVALGIEKYCFNN